MAFRHHQIITIMNYTVAVLQDSNEMVESVGNAEIRMMHQLLEQTSMVEDMDKVLWLENIIQAVI